MVAVLLVALESGVRKALGQILAGERVDAGKLKEQVDNLSYKEFAKFQLQARMTESPEASFLKGPKIFRGT